MSEKRLHNQDRGIATEPENPIAKIQVNAGISVIIPTFREAENIPQILCRLENLRRNYKIDLEVIFADDNSQDGSIEALHAFGADWAKILVRTENRGLSPAVIDGFREAKNPILVCMDCDLSHPPEKIPQMILALSSGQEFVIGSRYVPGGSTDDDWGVFRWLNSRVATLLARPLTSIKDPMSGFFALRRSDFDKAQDLNPVGYKIALELIVKCGFENVGEVPIQFTDRVYGESKLTLKEQLKYIQHLRRLYLYRFANAMHVLQFLVVGASGVIVNLAVLTLMVMLGLPEAVCLAGGIAVSLVTNFILNRRFTFSYARDRNIFKQFIGFMSASAVGFSVNYLVAIWMNNSILQPSQYSLHIAAMTGIAAGMIFNFLGNRFIVFRKRYVRNES